MKELNNENSDIYIETLKNQRKYIGKRLKTIKNRYLDEGCGLCDTKENIAKHLNKGPAQNLIQTFFKYKTNKCILCNKKKGEDGIRQFERAHCNNYSRYDLLLLAINKLYIDETTPIKDNEILREFIKLHDNCPIYMLCNKCHNKYDKNY